MARPVFLVFVYKKGYRLNSPARLLNVFPEPFTPSPTCVGDGKVPGLCTTHCLVFWSVIFGIWILSTSLALLVHLCIRYLVSDIIFSGKQLRLSYQFVSHHWDSLTVFQQGIWYLTFDGGLTDFYQQSAVALVFSKNELYSYFDIALQNEELHFCLSSSSEDWCMRFWKEEKQASSTSGVCMRKNYQQVSSWTASVFSQSLDMW